MAVRTILGLGFTSLGPVFTILGTVLASLGLGFTRLGTAFASIGTASCAFSALPFNRTAVLFDYFYAFRFVEVYPA